MAINELSFRTLVIDNPCALSYSGGSVVVKNEEMVEIPLVQLRNMIVNTNAVTITSSLLNELSKKNVKVVFCDEKHNPSFEISSFSGNVNSAGRVIGQSRWDEERKLYVWQKNELKKLKEISPKSGSVYAIPICISNFMKLYSASDKKFDFNLFTGNTIYM